MKSEIVRAVKSEEKQKFPRLMIDNEGMIVLRIDANTCLTVNAGEDGSWKIFDNWNDWDFGGMEDFDGVIQLSND